MNDILNLTVKKEVFESICNGTSDEIYINRSKWWDKRMIEESGEPKDFRIVSISSGDSGKFDFPIWTIDIQKKHILVKIARVKEEKVEEVENTPTPKVELTQEMFNELWKSAIRNDEETVDDEDVDENEQSDEDEDVDENEQSDEDEDEYVDPKDLTPKTKSIDVNDGIMEMFDKFCENKDVYLVPTPFATIKPNGKIVGVTSGDPVSHESMKGNKHTALSGKCLVIIQSAKNAGEIELTASAEGLRSRSVIINTK